MMGATGYDPSDHLVSEVKVYATDNPEAVPDLIAAEQAGKDRVTLVAWLEDLPTANPTDVDDETGPPPDLTPADPPSFSGRMGDFPLPDERHYFCMDVPSPFGHSGEDGEYQDAIQQIQVVVGTDTTGIYDVDTNSQVIAWRANHGSEDGEFVDAALWQQMDQTPPDGG